MGRSIVIAFSVCFLAGAVASADSFTAGNLVVSQVGDGTSYASGYAAPVFLKEFAATGGAAVQTLAMPTIGSGVNRRFVNSISASSEGMLTRSVDGRYLTLGGYDAAPGTAGVKGLDSATVNRVVGRVDWAGVIDTTTALLDAYNADNFRSVVSTNGVDMWLGGAGSDGKGVRYTTLGSGTSTKLASAPDDIRVVNSFSGQLYFSNVKSSAYLGVNTMGTGMPTSGGNSAAQLPGFSSASGLSPYDFYFADAGTLYLADDGGKGATPGLQKWTFNGTAWTLAYTMNAGLNGAGVRGLTGETIDGVTTLYAVTSEEAANRLVAITDAGASSAFSVLATAPTNTLFRGVDFAPTPEPASLALLALCGAWLGRRKR